jgi:hypothetical protein
MVVDIGVTKGTACDGVTAHADGSNRSHSVENLEQETLVHIRGEISDVKGGRMKGLAGSLTTSRRSRRGLGGGRSARSGFSFGSFLGSGWGRHGFGCCLVLRGRINLDKSLGKVRKQKSRNVGCF